MRHVTLALALIGCGDSSPAHVDAAIGDGHVDASTDAADPGVYAAYASIGGLDHLRIAKTIASTCFAIDLSSPGSNGMGVTLPSGWAWTMANAMQPAAACNPAYAGPITNTFAATAQSGTISFQGSGTPTTVDSVAVTLTFASPPAWCPPSEMLSATAIPVH